MSTHQFLRARRVNRHAAIKILLGCAHLDSNAEALQHLADAQSQNVQANHFFFRADADNLHLRRVLLLLIDREHVVEHVGEACLVHFDLVVAVTLARLGLGQADRADFWVRKDHGGDVFVG